MESKSDFISGTGRFRVKWAERRTRLGEVLLGENLGLGLGAGWDQSGTRALASILWEMVSAFWGSTGRL